MRPDYIRAGVLLMLLSSVGFKCHDDDNPPDVVDLTPRMEIYIITDINGNDLSLKPVIGAYNKVYFRYKIPSHNVTTGPTFTLTNPDNNSWFAVGDRSDIDFNTTSFPDWDASYYVWDGRANPSGLRRLSIPVHGYSLKAYMSVGFDNVSDTRMVALQANAWDTDLDDISNAVENKNNSATGIGQTVISDENGTGHSDWWQSASASYPPIISTSISSTNPLYVNRGTHDYSLAKGTASSGSLYNSLRIAFNNTGYSCEPVTENCDAQDTDNWGTLELINLIEATGRAWNAKYQNLPTASDNYPNITVKDMSRASGGSFLGTTNCLGHTQHQNGLEVDIRLVRTDNSTAAVDRFSQYYSPARTQQLVNLFIDLGRIVVIYFNDPNIVNVQSATGHDNHLHVWIVDPDGPAN